MKKLILLLFFIISISYVQAQYKTVVFDYEKSFFNEGQPLPAESYFIIQGEVPEEVDIVQATISKPNGEALYKAIWKRAESNEGTAFQLPVTYKLRSNNEYDIRINYFKKLSAKSSRKFNKQLYDYLDAYVDQIIKIEKNRIRLTEPVNQAVKSLNKIVERSTLYYDNKTDINFPGFSDLVSKSLKNIKNQDLREGKFNLFKKKDDTDQEVKAKYAKQQVEDLKELVQNEVAAFLNTDLLTVYNSKYISNYATEKLPNTLLINAGYGGVYFNGNINNLSYGSAPFAGIGFPLGNEAFASNILSKTTFSVGVFLTNFKNGENQTLSGPVVGRPIYVALGYPFMEFLRINAGAAILQNSTTAPNGINLQQITARPFIGLSIDLNLWLGVGKNKLR